ncbi:MAG: hypothetical protein RR900_02465, partial [Ruthenibacterium sp.]
MKDKRIKSILLLLAIVLSIIPIGFAADETSVPLHQKAFFTGSAETKTIYSAGTLHVFSSGLPQGIHGTTQDIAKTLVTDKAEFEVLPPLAAPTQ